MYRSTRPRKLLRARINIDFAAKTVENMPPIWHFHSANKHVYYSLAYGRSLFDVELGPMAGRFAVHKKIFYTRQISSPKREIGPGLRGTTLAPVNSEYR